MGTRNVLPAVLAGLFALALLACKTRPEGGKKVDPVAPDPRVSTVTAAPLKDVWADGEAAALITVVVKNNEGTPLAGREVTLTASGQENILEGPDRATGGDGVVTAALKSTKAGVKRIQASVKHPESSVLIEYQPEVTFIWEPVSARKSTVAAAPQTGVKANNSAFSTITVTVLNGEGRPVGGKNVTFSAGGSNNSFTHSSVTTDANGKAASALKSTTAEVKEVTAKVELDAATKIELAQKAVVEFVADADDISSVLSAVAADPSGNLPADAVKQTKISVTVRDSRGNAVPGQSVQLLPSGSENLCDGGQVCDQLKVTAADGAATFFLSSAKAETKTVNARVRKGTSWWPNVSNPASVTFVPMFSPVMYRAGAKPVSVTAERLSGGAFVVATVNQSNCDGSGSGTISIFSGTVPASFRRIDQGPDSSWACNGDLLAGKNPTSVALKDMDNDGALDLVVANQENPGKVTLLYLTNEFRPKAMGDGATQKKQVIEVYPNPYDVKAEEMDGASGPDLVLSHDGGSSSRISVLKNQGGLDANGFARFAATTYPTGRAPRRLAVADLNGDRRPDIVVGHYTESANVGVYLADAHGGYSAERSHDGGACIQSVAVSPKSIDAGTTPDIVAANRGGDCNPLSVPGNDISLFLGHANPDGTPTGSFPASRSASVRSSNYPTAVVVDDFNGDGKMDLASSGKGSRNMDVSLGKGDATFFARSTYAVDQSASDPLSLAKGDLNGDGLLDLIAANNAADGNGVYWITVFLRVK